MVWGYPYLKTPIWLLERDGECWVTPLTEEMVQASRRPPLKLKHGWAIENSSCKRTFSRKYTTKKGRVATQFKAKFISNLQLQVVQVASWRAGVMGTPMVELWDWGSCLWHHFDCKKVHSTNPYDWHMRVGVGQRVIVCPPAARKWNSELKKMQLRDVNKLFTWKVHA